MPGCRLYLSLVCSGDSIIKWSLKASLLDQIFLTPNYQTNFRALLRKASYMSLEPSPRNCPQGSVVCLFFSFVVG